MTFISLSSTVLSLILIVSSNTKLPSASASAETGCPPINPLSCAGVGQCTMGIKDYQTLLGLGMDIDIDDNVVGLIETSKRGMHCICRDDFPGQNAGFTGVNCQTPFERCGDNSICFNGGYCELDSSSSSYDDYEKYHCACPRSYDGKIYAGRACEIEINEALDVCELSSSPPSYDVVGSKWFCTNGGNCIDDETYSARKCDCQPGFTGPHCEYAEYDYDECLLPCYNGGICKKGAKELSAFVYGGMDIDAFLGGTNLDGEHCACPDGFTGLQCNVTDVVHCGGGVCFNGGICVEQIREDGTFVDFVCQCDTFNNFDTTTGTTTAVGGKFCEHRDVAFCPAPPGHDPALYYCANGGQCPRELNGPCVNCNEGWTGSRCETMIVYEESVEPTEEGTVEEETDEEECDIHCHNGGVCFFSEDLFEYSTIMEQVSPKFEFLFDNKHCKCLPGYVGLRCELKTIPRVEEAKNVITTPATSGGISISKPSISFISTIITAGILVLATH